MAAKNKKEPIIVLVIFLIIQISLIVLFAVRGNFEALQERFDWKQLAIIGAVLFIIYILYVELRGKAQLLFCSQPLHHHLTVWIELEEPNPHPCQPRSTAGAPRRLRLDDLSQPSQHRVAIYQRQGE